MTADDPRPAGEAPDLMAALRRSIERPRPAASGGATGGEDEYAGHVGSCRIFYAEHRCTCVGPPFPPVASQADGDRERLAAALVESNMLHRSDLFRWDFADALLPVVRALVAEGKAAELEKLAAAWEDQSRDWYYDNRHTHGYGINYVAGYEEGWEHAGQLAVDRAAALRAATTEDGTA